MKRRILTGFAIILAIAMVAACGNPAPTTVGEPSNNVKLDKNVNLTVSTNPSDIQSFTASKGYSPANKAQADAIIDAIFSSDDGPFSGIGLFSINQQSSDILYSRSTASRAAETQRIQFNFTEKDFADEDNAQFLTIKGYVDALASFDDASEYFALNGEAKARIEIIEGLKDDNYETFGIIAGEITANNVVVTGTAASGSISYTINGAINVADIKQSVWVKCIFQIKNNLSLSSTEVKVTINITAYGNDNAVLGTYNKEMSSNLDNFFEE